MSGDPGPGRDCDLCPRLVEFRLDIREKHSAWHNAPVKPFGSGDAAFLIVGLAPGLRGANRTGRPFTGDFAGDLLFATLARYGFSSGTYDMRPDDNLKLVDCRITNAVKCVPPKNKPIGSEMASCRAYLAREIDAMPRLRVMLALGRIAHENILKALGVKLAAMPFAHGARHDLDRGMTLFDSYHCSRYNTNTRRLTERMFQDVVAEIRICLDR